MQRKRILLAVIAMVLTGLFGFYLFFNNSGNEGTNNGTIQNQFNLEGTVTFLGDNGEDTLADVRVEIVDNEAERTRGLMHRLHMPDSVGMLFVFNAARQQAFWMKNTKIPLDMIFVDSDRRIVKIHSFTTPFSPQSYPSGAPAQYVVEVNAGYCDAHDIDEGDYISF